MNYLQRFNRLTIWNKIGAVGAIASITGIVATLLFFYIGGGNSKEKGSNSFTTGPQSPIIKHKGEGDITVHISPSNPAESASQLEIHILQHYRTRFQFSLVNQSSTHWAVKRLYLKYVAEFDWDISTASTEGLMFRINYGIALSREYSEYDLLPFTPDQEVHGFEYRGPDSDHFTVQLYGTNVSIVRICAEIYDYNKKKHGTIESDDIHIVSSPALIPKWETPLEVAPRKLLSDIKPLSYKVLTNLNYDEFLRRLQPFQIRNIQSDLHKVLSLMQGHTTSDAGGALITRVERVTLITRVERILKEIDDIRKE